MGVWVGDVVPSTLIWGRLFHLSVPRIPHLFSDGPHRMHLRGLGGLNGQYIPPFIKKLADSCREVY